MRQKDVLRLFVALVFFITGLGQPSSAETAPGKKAVTGLPASETGDRRFAWVELGGNKHAIAIQGNTFYFDRDGNGDVGGSNESKPGVLEDRGTPLFQKKATVLATIDGLNPPIKNLTAEWEPKAELPGVLLTTGEGENKLELAFSPFAPTAEAGPLFRFGADDRVISVYGEPLGVHRAMGHDNPTLVVRIGRPGDGEKSFVAKWHANLDTTVNPKATITFNPGKPDEKMVKAVLNHRC